MSKRLFRPRQKDDSAHYPTIEEFDQNRRTFFSHLGAVLMGSLLISGALIGCEAESQGPAGIAPAPDARIDTIDARPDGENNSTDLETKNEDLLRDDQPVSDTLVDGDSG